jgi:hypothetical protein
VLSWPVTGIALPLPNIVRAVKSRRLRHGPNMDKNEVYIKYEVFTG